MADTKAQQYEKQKKPTLTARVSSLEQKVRNLFLAIDRQKPVDEQFAQVARDYLELQNLMNNNISNVQKSIDKDIKNILENITSLVDITNRQEVTINRMKLIITVLTGIFVFHVVVHWLT